MKKLYKATAVMGVSTFVAMAAGLVRAKFLALALGPEGVGIFSQALTFFQSIETVAALGIGLGVTNYVSEAWAQKRPDRIGDIVSSSCMMQLFVSVVSLALVALFRNEISRLIFSSDKYATLLVVSSAGVLFAPILVTLESAVLGAGQAGRFSLARIIYYIGGLIVLMAMVGGFGLEGGFFFMLVNALVSLGVVFTISFLPVFGARPIFAAGSFRFEVKESVSYFKKIFSYGALMLVTSAITWFSLLFVRSLIINSAGPAGNGLYQVVFALVGYYTPFFTNGVWGYLFPKLSATKDASIFNLEVNRALRFIILFTTPVITVMFLLRRPLVLLIFSGEFLGCLEIFPLYLAGSLFFLVSYIISTTFLAGRQLGSYFCLNTGQNLLFVVLFAALVPKIGLTAVAFSYLAANLLTCVLGAAYQIYRIKLKFSRNIIMLFLLSAAFMAMEFFILPETAVSLFVKWGLVAAWLLFVVGKREKALLLSFIRQRGSSN